MKKQCGINKLLAIFITMLSVGCSSFFQKQPQFSVNPILTEESDRGQDLEKNFNMYYDLYKEANTKKKPGAFEFLLKASEARQALGETELALAGYFECYENAIKENSFNLKLISAQRLAVVYSMLGKESDSKKYFDIVEKEASNIPLIDRDWLYLQLGHFKGYSLTEASDSGILKLHSQTQKYLLRVLNSSNAIVRSRAKEELLFRYRDMIRWLQLLNEPKAQVDFGSGLSDAIVQAELYKPNENEVLTSEQGDFFEFLEVMTSEVRDWVYKPSAQIKGIK